MQYSSSVTTAGLENCTPFLLAAFGNSLRWPFSKHIFKCCLIAFWLNTVLDGLLVALQISTIKAMAKTPQSCTPFCCCTASTSMFRMLVDGLYIAATCSNVCPVSLGLPIKVSNRCMACVAVLCTDTQCDSPE